MRITHITQPYLKATKFLTLTALFLLGVLFVVNTNPTQATDKIVVPVPTIMEGKEILNFNPTDTIDCYAEDYLENYDDTIMIITNGGHFVGVGNQFFTIEIIDDDYIFEGNLTSIEYQIDIYPNVPIPYISGETSFEYDGEEHCVTLVYDDKHVGLSSIPTYEDQNPPICATEPGTYHIYALLVRGFKWIRTDNNDVQDLVWEITTPEITYPKVPDTGIIQTFRL